MQAKTRGYGLWLAVWLAFMGGRAFAVEATLIADAHVNAALPAMNSGAISNVNVGGGYTGLMQFDLSLLPAGTTPAQISRAVLRLYVNRVDTAGVVSLNPLTGAWSEYGVTYQTLPAMGAAAQIFNISQQGEFVQVDVTALVQAWVAAPATNFGFALTAGTAVAQFDSKENDLTAHPATLDIGIVSQGPTGATGPVGPAGLQGVQGLTGSNGPAGATGAAGPAGAAGAAGAAGPQGPQGVAGVAGAQGPAGPQGLSGANGANGAAGTPGLVYQGAYESTTNYALGDVVLWQGSSWASLLAANHDNTPSLSPAYWGALTSQGPVGATGATGAQGPAGAVGLTGATGPPGSTGPQGPQGIAGTAGAQGIPGSTGAQGLSGPAGPVGAAGPVGLTWQGTYSAGTNYALADGVMYNGAGYVSLAANNHGNTPDQSPAQWALFAAGGAAGATGAVGPAGPPGPQGVAGAVGPAGAAGATGAIGPQGPPVANYTGNYASATNYAVADAVSYAGSTYISLASGNHGNTPDQSPAYWAVLAAEGPAGPQGAVGAAGAAGPAGAAGATGPAGPQGPPAAFQGGWLTGQAYNTGDAVSYGGGSYIALTANMGREPDVSPIYWGVLAQAGATGQAGPTGATGLQGPMGSSGAAGAAGMTGAAGVAGATGPAGAAATVQIGSVTTGSAGTSAVVSNSGTSTAAVLNFTIPQGAAGSGGSGAGGSASGVPYQAMYHAVSYAYEYYSLNNTNQSASETSAVLSWVPQGCSATRLDVYSQQNATITVTLRSGLPDAMGNTTLSCSVANGQSCSATGAVVIAAGQFVDLSILNPDSNPSGVWVALSCN